MYYIISGSTVSIHIEFCSLTDLSDDPMLGQPNDTLMITETEWTEPTHTLSDLPIDLRAEVVYNLSQRQTKMSRQFLKEVGY